MSLQARWQSAAGLLQDGRWVLLCRQGRSHHRTPLLWELPHTTVLRNQAPRASLADWLADELGVHAHLEHTPWAVTANSQNTSSIWVATRWDGVPRNEHNRENLTIRWFALDHLDDVTLGPLASHTLLLRAVDTRTSHADTPLRPRVRAHPTPYRRQP